MLLGHPRIHLALLSSSETNPERVFRLRAVVLFSYFSTMLSVTVHNLNVSLGYHIGSFAQHVKRAAGAVTPFILQSNPTSPLVLITIFVI